MTRVLICLINREQHGISLFRPPSTNTSLEIPAIRIGALLCRTCANDSDVLTSACLDQESDCKGRVSNEGEKGRAAGLNGLDMAESVDAGDDATITKIQQQSPNEKGCWSWL